MITQPLSLDIKREEKQINDFGSPHKRNLILRR
jgi:hypothetical protein